MRVNRTILKEVQTASKYTGDLGDSGGWSPRKCKSKLSGEYLLSPVIKLSSKQTPKGSEGRGDVGVRNSLLGAGCQSARTLKESK